VFGQGTPNWGTDNSQTRTVSPATTSPSPWGGASAPAAPQRPQHSTQVAAKAEPIPPALAELLKRPDQDLITLPNGQSRTVSDIRAETNTRRAVLEALKTGAAPAGRKRVRLAIARSPQHDELLNASHLVRDTARREAAASWAAPSTIAEVPTGQGNPPAGWTAPVAHAGQGNPATGWTAPVAHTGQGDPAAAWAQSGAASNMRSKGRQAEAAALTAPAAATELHSGIGNSAMSQSGSAFPRPEKQPVSTGVSQRPSQSFVAQTSPSGIAIVNGHSKGVQFTPGGLYTVIGWGFGGAVGEVDLVGPHLPGGRLALQVTQWGDRVLQAQLPEPVSGIADQPVTLRVTTRAGTLLTKDVQFFATRQPLILGVDELDLSQAFELNLGNPNDWSDTRTSGAQITRTKSGNNIDCPSVGQDSLRTKLPPGWALAELAINSWLPTQGNPNKDFYGQDGDTVVSGAYTINQIPAGLTNQTFDVHWGVLRSHSTNGFSLIANFTGNDFAWSGNDGCVSGYDVEATLVGPAGVHPF
jgi:hypothetical protein